MFSFGQPISWLNGRSLINTTCLLPRARTPGFGQSGTEPSGSGNAAVRFLERERADCPAHVAGAYGGLRRAAQRGRECAPAVGPVGAVGRAAGGHGDGERAGPVPTGGAAQFLVLAGLVHFRHPAPGQRDQRGAGPDAGAGGIAAAANWSGGGVDDHSATERGRAQGLRANISLQCRFGVGEPANPAVECTRAEQL